MTLDGNENYDVLFKLTFANKNISTSRIEWKSRFEITFGIQLSRFETDIAILQNYYTLSKKCYRLMLEKFVIDTNMQIFLSRQTVCRQNYIYWQIDSKELFKQFVCDISMCTKIS